MLKKQITYTDFNGDTVTEDFYFHLSKADLIELEMSHNGGLSAAMQRIVAAEDTKSILEEFKNIILLSYGQRSLDGKRFIKNDQLREEFKSSEAYSTLFMELVTETDSAVKFMNGIIPADMLAQAQNVVTPPEPEKPEPRKMTTSEAMAEMTGQELTDKIVSGEVVIVDSR